MFHWKILGLFLAAVALGAGSAMAQGDAVQAEMQKLQGTWQVTMFIDQSEKAAPAGEIKDFTFQFHDNTVILRKDNRDSGVKSKYTVNPSKDPKWIDLDGVGSLNVTAGIYKLDGGELHICVVAGSRGGK